MKLSASFLQVWQGDVWTLTTDSSDSSTRAGRNQVQVHHMVPRGQNGLSDHDEKAAANLGSSYADSKLLTSLNPDCIPRDAKYDMIW